VARIGLVPMSAKPYHAGHDGLVRIAAKDNDKVVVFVSETNRDYISGEGMMRVWKELIEPTLPSNVEVVYGGSPVGHAFKVIGDADQAGSQDTFNVYSDPDDASRMATLPKYAPNLMANKQVNLVGVDRTATVNVSGTQMRQWFDAGDKEQFTKHLPKGVDGERYWDTLQATKLDKPEPKGTKKPKAKKPVQGEGLLRSYVREVLKS